MTRDTFRFRGGTYERGRWGREEGEPAMSLLHRPEGEARQPGNKALTR